MNPAQKRNDMNQQSQNAARPNRDSEKFPRKEQGQALDQEDSDVEAEEAESDEE